MGSIIMTKYALNELRKAKGQIIAISSLSGEMGLGMRSAYCASKAAMSSFFRSLAIEEQDIRISIMMPNSFSGSKFRDNSLIKGSEIVNNGKVDSV